MNTTFKSAAESAAHLAGKPEMAELVKRQIRRSQLVSLLVQMRIDKNITQEQVADSMKCDPSKISRMESGSDSQLRLWDIMGYTKALGVQASVMLDDNSLPVSTRVKQCVFQIDRDLKKLTQMVQEHDGNEVIANKISQFYQEVLFNFLMRFEENHEMLCNYIPLKAPNQAEECESAESVEPAEQTLVPEQAPSM
jgi:transcriptional regulator with XRE-family HTH domain